MLQRVLSISLANSTQKIHASIESIEGLNPKKVMTYLKWHLYTS